MPSKEFPPNSPRDFQLWCVECRSRMDARMDAQAALATRLESDFQELKGEVKCMKNELHTIKLAMAKWAGVGGFAGAALVMIGNGLLKALLAP